MNSTLFPTRSFHTTYTTHIVVPEYAAKCQLYLYHALPPSVFADPYELVHREQSYSAFHWGTANLELPVSAVSSTGSAVLLNVTRDAETLEIAVELPLHARYQELDESGGHTVQVPWPMSFVSCPNIEHPGDLPPLPFELAALFDAKTNAFTTLSTPGFETLEVPTGRPSDHTWVEIGTTTMILSSFAYLASLSVQTARRINQTRDSRKKE